MGKRRRGADDVRAARIDWFRRIIKPFIPRYNEVEVPKDDLVAMAVGAADIGAASVPMLFRGNRRKAIRWGRNPKNWRDIRAALTAVDRIPVVHWGLKGVREGTDEDVRNELIGRGKMQITHEERYDALAGVIGAEPYQAARPLLLQSSYGSE